MELLSEEEASAACCSAAACGVGRISYPGHERAGAGGREVRGLSGADARADGVSASAV